MFLLLKDGLLKVEYDGKHPGSQFAERIREFVFVVGDGVASSLVNRHEEVVEADGVFEFWRDSEVFEVECAACTELDVVVGLFEQYGALTVACEVERDAAASKEIDAVVVEAWRTVFQVERNGDECALDAGSDDFVVLVVAVAERAVAKVKARNEAEVEVFRQSEVADDADGEARGDACDVGMIQLAVDLLQTWLDAEIHHVETEGEAEVGGLEVAHGQVLCPQAYTCHECYNKGV